MALRKRTDLLVLHTSATRASMDIGVKEIRSWHKAKGWSDIGYHWLIRRSGEIEPGRQEKSIGAHVAGWNSRSIGVCMVGGLNDRTGKAENNYTPAQWRSLKTLVGNIVVRYPGIAILGHRDLSPDRDGDGIVERAEWLKECPCFHARDWANDNGFRAAPGRTQGEGENKPEDRIYEPGHIEQAQLDLKRHGFDPGPIDGVMGPQTRRAIKAFQRANNLEVTAVLDSPMLSMLKRENMWLKQQQKSAQVDKTAPSDFDDALREQMADVAASRPTPPKPKPLTCWEKLQNLLKG